MNKENIKDITGDTCFGSLAFCCDLTKSCQARDHAMKGLGLKPEEYLKLKQDFNNSLERIISNKGESNG